jgi:hypothetical protein
MESSLFSPRNLGAQHAVSDFLRDRFLADRAGQFCNPIAMLSKLRRGHVDAVVGMTGARTELVCVPRKRVQSGHEDLR